MGSHAIPTTPLVHPTITTNKKTVRNVIPAYIINKLTYCYGYWSYWQGYEGNIWFAGPKDRNDAEGRGQYFCWKVEHIICCPYPSQPLFDIHVPFTTDTSILSKINQPFVSYLYFGYSVRPRLNECYYSCDVAVQHFLYWTGRPVSIKFVRLVELTYVL